LDHAAVRDALFTVLGIPITGYAWFIALGFVFAVAMGALWIRRIGFNPDVVVDLGLLSVVTGLAGARLLHVLADGYFWDYVHLCTAPSEVNWRVPGADCAPLGGIWDAAGGTCHPKAADCWAWAQIGSGGLTFYGGLIAATATAVWLFRRDGLPLWKGVDMGGMMVPIGLGLGRVGCLMAGCCFGKTCTLPWALHFPARSPASDWQYRAGLLTTPALPALPVHPTQIYEAVAALGIASFLILYLQARKRYDGQLFVAFLGLYGVARFGLEWLRSDDRGGWLLSTSQWTSLVLCAVAFLLQRRLRRQAFP
jgi:phosphatidylglycerol---prolipoprotein diacylglyceryl transferase